MILGIQWAVADAKERVVTSRRSVVSLSFVTDVSTAMNQAVDATVAAANTTVVCCRGEHQLGGVEYLAWFGEVGGDSGVG